MTASSPDIRALAEAARTLHDKIVADIPQLRRGLVWCKTCGIEQSINAADALRSGWPKCCGYIMTIDSPEERSALQKLRSAIGGEGEGG